jgi:succinoglycan biosynthesis transport protein ExoP
MTIPQTQTGSLESGSQDALATTLHSFVRFLRTVRLRSGILLACLVVAGVLGAVYYATAARIYESNASLYIVQVGNGINKESFGQTSDPSKGMPTFKRLMTSEEVMTGAYERLPERFRAGFKNMTDDEAAKVIAKSLSVSAAFNTNVLDLSYRSRDPKVACAVLAVVLNSYKSFMDNVNKSSSSENLDILKQKLEQLNAVLTTEQQERQRLKALAPELIGVLWTVRMLSTCWPKG